MSELSEDPKTVTDRLGLELVLPKDNELFIDLDDAPSEAALRDGITVLRNNGVPVEVSKITRSNGGNKHAYLTIGIDHPLSPLERVALQACLGSDRKREALAFLRILYDIKIPASCFFEKPNAQEIVITDVVPAGEWL